jgi:hypothetical protein
VGDRVLTRPGSPSRDRRGFALGRSVIMAYKENYSVTGLLQEATDSVDGFKAMERAFRPARASQ